MRYRCRHLEPGAFAGRRRRTGQERRRRRRRQRDGATNGCWQTVRLRGAHLQVGRPLGRSGEHVHVVRLQGIRRATGNKNININDDYYCR